MWFLYVSFLCVWFLYVSFENMPFLYVSLLCVWFLYVSFEHMSFLSVSFWWRWLLFCAVLVCAYPSCTCRPCPYCSCTCRSGARRSCTCCALPAYVILGEGAKRQKAVFITNVAKMTTPDVSTTLVVNPTAVQLFCKIARLVA